ncbi:MAG: UDP-N-acetylmuramoyl-tripeptide--D-alanyl-D-alanine ligase [Gammaproteobacteria bacterium]|nr:UDP-N-acetylmuramoyl-tripeptide--D-alanyl-D-alanine ligase [Gammaproteobacteria bacterium]NIR98315.1 UDP-N-acetylmuramoyl-tripeptide--D-alanyl-D-alanine ligase [Gammaproteobacteria bacterium]NIT64062.1 UDP-N-acetylmuramoyl-tripeptide--D-alanyl-D-alanine ligase [Gammaproteobacteria bacterium]NIV20993.1 UDP-N-acetylmuramoyl-tripeptide--D-alanyl-D-alanine ligase [Gammaproteobacteria bacterium]NIX10390.1 UDP-N-acetylmuramoyl-tripeptide--D-alanyl-D-alanine ligase [Gammaproteobacteria bacterium]
MNAMWLSEAAAGLGAMRRGKDVQFAGVCTDSRRTELGTLFVALRGARVDGHEFVDQAAARGAAGAMVSRELDTSLPLLKVGDTRRALGGLAALWRRGSAASVVAVTGSNGKTSVKEMLAAILAHCGPVLATRGNLNNDIGLPLTLLELRDPHRYAVVEMGANHFGEIDYLSRIARPDVAVITNAGAAHLEGFGDVAGVARAKAEIFGGMAPGGTAVINADDPQSELWREAAVGLHALTFGLNQRADVSAYWQPEGEGGRMELHTSEGDCALRLPLPGVHNIMNALAAAAAGLAAGAGLEEIRRGLEAVRPVRGRLQWRGTLGGVGLLDDTYNANPTSLDAALEVLVATPGEKWLVLGDMAELGGEAEALHEQAGRLARAAGVGRLYAVGSASAAAVDGFGAGARHFTDWRELVEQLRRDWPQRGTVLVKGSRSMHMERVIEALLQAGVAGGGH